MKKLSIILLALLIVFSFSSCKKDKTEDVISAYENFKKIGNVGGYAARLFGDGLDTCDDSESLNLSVDKTFKGRPDFTAFMNLIGIDEYKGTEASATGTITGLKDGRKLDVTFDITVTYLTDKTFKVTGAYKYDQGDTGTGPAADVDLSYDFTINGTGYAVSCKIDENGKCTSASVNGTDVDPRLVDAGSTISTYGF